MGCEECSIAYDEDPPCDDCEMPEPFLSNQLAWKVWQICSKFERPPSFGGVPPISAIRAAQVLDLYDGTLADFEKVLTIEDEMLPWLREEQKRNSPKKSDNSEGF